MNNLTLQVLSPSGTSAEFSGLESIHVRLENGLLLGIYPRHARFIGSVSAQTMKIVFADRESFVEIPRGILRVEKDHVRILTVEERGRGQNGQ